MLYSGCGMSVSDSLYGGWTSWKLSSCRNSQRNRRIPSNTQRLLATHAVATATTSRAIPEALSGRAQAPLEAPVALSQSLVARSTLEEPQSRFGERLGQGLGQGVSQALRGVQRSRAAHGVDLSDQMR